MDALIMCGGQGTRLGADEKPLVRVGGEAMIGRISRALAESSLDRVYAVTSSHAPQTASRVGEPRIETPGVGYVADLQVALADDRIEQPVLTVAADLPLLDGSVVDAVLGAYDDGSLRVAVPVGRVTALGYSADTTFSHGGHVCRPAGINVVGHGQETVWVTRDPRVAAHVNRPSDLRAARWQAAPDRFSA